MLYATTIPANIDPRYRYDRGVLVNDAGTIVWECDHAHPVTVYDVWSRFALECAEYEKEKRGY